QFAVAGGADPVTVYVIGMQTPNATPTARSAAKTMKVNVPTTRERRTTLADTNSFFIGLDLVAWSGPERNSGYHDEVAFGAEHLDFPARFVILWSGTPHLSERWVSGLNQRF